MNKRLLILALFAFVMAAPFFQGAAAKPADDDATAWEKFKSFWKEEKPLPPEDELFAEAEAHFYGRETWWGKAVRKTQGEDSQAYEKWWGVKRKNFTKAKELYQQFADNYRYSKNAPIAELRLADCSYELEEYEAAAFAYRQFRQTHPLHPEAPFALFREALCHQQLMLKPGRDQKDTREAAALYEVLIKTYPDYKERPEAEKNLQECKVRLCEHEFLVAGFYFKKKEYWSAAARYRGVWANYPGVGFDAEALYREGLCYEALGKNDLALIVFDRAAADFPESEFAPDAKERADKIRKDAPEKAGEGGA